MASLHHSVIDTNRIMQFKRSRVAEKEKAMHGNYYSEIQGETQLKGILGSTKISTTRPGPIKETLEFGLEQAQKSKNDKHEADNYKKQHNLKLDDYLRLTQMSNKSKKKEIRDQRSKQKSEGRRPKTNRTVGEQPSTQTPEIKNQAIDNTQAIRMIKEQTLTQLDDVSNELTDLLKEIQKSECLKDDEESLVFMCNVLSIFQQKIGMSVNIAEELVQQQKKVKQIADLKKYGKEEMPLRKVKQKKGKKINNYSEIYKSYSNFMK